MKHRATWVIFAAAMLAAGVTHTASSQPAPPPEIAEIPVVLLVDTGAGQTLFAREAERRFLPASLTKVMTIETALGRIAEHKLSPDQRLTVRPATHAAWQSQGSTMLLHSGENVPVDALLHGIATVSANNAAVVLAEGVAGSVPGWTAMMNAEADRLGLGCSRFATPNGWPDQGATIVCARDLVKLATVLIDRHPQAYRRYFGQPAFTWNGVSGRNRNPLLGAVAGADGIKTGHTNEAGYNLLGSAERDGRRLIMVVAGAKTELQRATASRALIEWGFSAWQSHKLFEPGAQVASARVQGGDARRVALTVRKPVSFATVARDDRISATVVYNGPLSAPIAKGAQVAVLRIVSASGLSAEVPLLAVEAVGKAGPVDRLLNGVAAWFS